MISRDNVEEKLKPRRQQSCGLICTLEVWVKHGCGRYLRVMDVDCIESSIWRLRQRGALALDAQLDVTGSVALRSI
jgi:hypothetical protein